MSEKLTTLAAWARAKYGEHGPTIATVRRWVRDGNILPPPRKHGRSYYVSERARYVAHNDRDYPRLAREFAHESAAA